MPPYLKKSVSKVKKERAGIKDIYLAGTAKKIIFLVALAVLMLIIAFSAAFIGASSVGPGDALRVIGAYLMPNYFQKAGDLAEAVIIVLRLPRILLAVITGISLAGAGAVMQGILRNPLVSPYTLGMSGGASFGAALAIVLGGALLGTRPIAVTLLVAVSAFFLVF